MWTKLLSALTACMLAARSGLLVCSPHLLKKYQVKNKISFDDHNASFRRLQPGLQPASSATGLVRIARKSSSSWPFVHVTVLFVCRCLPIRHSQAQRPISCVLSWHALQPARCCALPATSLPMRRGAWTRLRTSPHLPPLTWPPLLLGPTATPISRSKVGAASFFSMQCRAVQQHCMLNRGSSRA